MPVDDPLTPDELEFRALLGRPGAFREWADAVREAWERTPQGRAAVVKQHGQKPAKAAA